MYDIDSSIIGSIPNINYKWKIKGAILASLYNTIVILKQVQYCGSLSGIPRSGELSRSEYTSSDSYIISSFHISFERTSPP